MSRVAMYQICPEHPLTVERYCGDDGHEERQNVMMMACAAWAVEAGWALEFGWDVTPACPQSDVQVVFLVLFSVAGYRLKNTIAQFKANRSCKVIVCGPHAVSFPDHCHRAGADAVVGRCDRELFLQILSDIKDDSLRRSYATNRSVGQLPPYSRYKELGLVPRQSYMNVIASTGCPYTCEFCTDAQVDYSAAPAQQTLRSIASSDEPMVVFNDPTFGIGKEGRTVLDGLARMEGRYFSGFTTSGMLREAKFRKQLSDANFVLIEVGIENINSPFAKNKNAEFTEIFAECDFIVITNYILGYDERDLNGSTEEFLARLVERCPNVIPVVFAPFSLPETPLHQQPGTTARIFDPSYLCVGNDILSMRVAGANSPADYYRKLESITGRLFDGFEPRMRGFIDGHPRFDSARKKLMNEMINRNLRIGEAIDNFISKVASAAPDSYVPFAQAALRRAIPNFDRYDLALDPKSESRRANEIHLPLA